MSTRPGQVVPKRWNPLRAEVERVLADGAWHEADLVFYEVERFVDPRVAARSWAREYQQAAERKLERGYVDEVEPASRVMVRDHQRVLTLGRWRVYWDCIRMMRRLGRAETQVWGGRRRVRIRPG